MSEFDPFSSLPPELLALMTNNALPNAPRTGGMPGPQTPDPRMATPPMFPPPPAPHPGIGQILSNPGLLNGIAQLMMATMGGKNGGYMAQGAQNSQQQIYERQRQQQLMNQQGEYQRAQVGLGKERNEIEQSRADAEQKRWDYTKAAGEAETARKTANDYNTELQQADTQARTLVGQMSPHASDMEVSLVVQQFLRGRHIKPEDIEPTVQSILTAHKNRDRYFVDPSGNIGVNMGGLATEAGYTPVGTMQAANDLAKNRKPKEGTPGVDLPFSPAVAEQKKQIAAAGKQPPGELTPGGLDAAATQYAMTGQMPALGMGNAGMRAAIINRAAVMFPGLNPAANSADYSANKTSLTSMQKMRDAVVAFENTALKNWDLFEKSAQKVVDSGSPLANTPIRMINEKVLGGPELTAFKAAKQVAVNEIAKVTSNPTLAGQLSDQARKEVSEFVPENATMAQILSVGKVLRQDMANRKQSVDKGIQEIQGRIRGQGSTGSNNNSNQSGVPAVGGTFNGETVRSVTRVE